MQVTTYTVICSDHFDLNSFYWNAPVCGQRRRHLKPDAVPTLFEWTTEKRRRRLLRRHVTSSPVVDMDTTGTLTADEGAATSDRFAICLKYI